MTNLQFLRDIIYALEEEGFDDSDSFNICAVDDQPAVITINSGSKLFVYLYDDDKEKGWHLKKISTTDL